MRHLKKGRQLSRNYEKRLALFRNLALALFRHERIITTLPKAKAVRPFVEQLITLARKGGLHSRRLAIMQLGPAANAEVKPKERDDQKDADSRTIVQKLFSDLGPRFKTRPGGYTRIIKRVERRLGDAGATAYLELLKEGEVRIRKRAAAPVPAPAPAPEEKPEEKPQAEAPTETPVSEAPKEEAK